MDRGDGRSDTLPPTERKLHLFPTNLYASCGRRHGNTNEIEPSGEHLNTQMRGEMVASQMRQARPQPAGGRILNAYHDVVFSAENQDINSQRIKFVCAGDSDLVMFG